MRKYICYQIFFDNLVIIQEKLSGLNIMAFLLLIDILPLSRMNIRLQLSTIIQLHPKIFLSVNILFLVFFTQESQSEPRISLTPTNIGLQYMAIVPRHPSCLSSKFENKGITKKLWVLEKNREQIWIHRVHFS